MKTKRQTQFINGGSGTGVYVHADIDDWGDIQNVSFSCQNGWIDTVAATAPVNGPIKTYKMSPADFKKYR